MEVTSILIPPEAARAVQESDVFLKAYESYEITTSIAYATAGEDLKALKANYKALDEKRKSLTKPLDESKKRIMDFFRIPLAKLEGAAGKVSMSMVSWHNEQERIRRAEEDRLREVQRKEAARLAKVADKAQDRGDTKKRDEFDARSEEVSFAAPAVVPSTTKVAGLAMTKLWKYRIVDESKIPRQYMIPNAKMLGELARTMKGLAEIPGVVVYSEDSVRGTR